MTDAQCKICRRAGEKLFLKGERCFTPKCSFERKPYAPGMAQSDKKHRRPATEFGAQLQEKQKVKNIYRMREKQFTRYVDRAMSVRGANPAEKLYEHLETRLDNVAYRSGFGYSRSTAKQLVSHGHIAVNGSRIDVPSYQVKVGDVVSVHPRSRELRPFASLAEKLKKHKAPPWISLNPDDLSGKVERLPNITEADIDLNLSSVVEVYSR